MKALVSSSTRPQKDGALCLGLALFGVLVLSVPLTGQETLSTLRGAATDASGAVAPGVSITVEDNGKGLPPQGRERLTEPYVTTRTKGTGLGLAIVKKIMEDHHGELMLSDREQGGACVRLIFAGDAATGRLAAPAVSVELSSVSHGA